MPMPFAPTMRADEAAHVKLAFWVMALSVQMLTNAKTKESATGTRPAPTTPGPMPVPVMLATGEMGTTCALTQMNVQRLLMFVPPHLATKDVKTCQVATVAHAAAAFKVTGRAAWTLMNVPTKSAVCMQTA